LTNLSTHAFFVSSFFPRHGCSRLAARTHSSADCGAATGEDVADEAAGEDAADETVDEGAGEDVADEAVDEAAGCTEAAAKSSSTSFSGVPMANE
jgi:hypothetical protein